MTLLKSGAVSQCWQETRQDIASFSINSEIRRDPDVTAADTLLPFFKYKRGKVVREATAGEESSRHMQLSGSQLLHSPAEHDVLSV